MQSLSLEYENIERAIDDVRQLLDEWLDASDEPPMSAWQNHASDGPPLPSRSLSANHRGEAEDPQTDLQADRAADQDSPLDDPGRSRAGDDTRPPDEPVSRAPDAFDNSAENEADAERNARPSIVRYVQVVLHEWLANLVQHACFAETDPHVEITIRMRRRYISCSVVDNSTGFNLSEQLETQRTQAQALPERGMGLRIISACTDQCEYRPLDDGRYHFEFSIPVDHEPWLSTLF